MPSGRNAFIGLSKEVTFATPVAASVYHRFRGGEAVRTEIPELTPPNILGTQPDEGPTYQGLKTHGGPIPFDAHPNILGYYLLGALGPVSTVQDEVGIRWTHTFTPRLTQFSADCWPQPFTWEIGRDMTQSFQYSGGIVNTLELSIGVDTEQVLLANAGLLARTMTRITATSPSGIETTQAFRWHQVAVTLPDPTAFATMRSLRMLIDNQMTSYAYLNGTLEVGDMRPGDNQRVITVEGVMRANTSEFTEFINGTQRSLKLVFTGPTLGTSNFMLTLEFPAFRYIAKDLGVPGPGEIMVGFRGKAKYDSAVSNTPMRAILRNSLSAY